MKTAETIHCVAATNMPQFVGRGYSSRHAPRAVTAFAKARPFLGFAAAHGVCLLRFVTIVAEMPYILRETAALGSAVDQQTNLARHARPECRIIASTMAGNNNGI